MDDRPTVRIYRTHDQHLRSSTTPSETSVTTPAPPGTHSWLIMGTNSGFGRAITEAALDAGDRIVATSLLVAPAGTSKTLTASSQAIPPRQPQSSSPRSEATTARSGSPSAMTPSTESALASRRSAPNSTSGRAMRAQQPSPPDTEHDRQPGDRHDRHPVGNDRRPLGPRTALTQSRTEREATQSTHLAVPVLPAAQQYVDGVNAGDLDAVVNSFAPEGRVVDVSRSLVGRSIGRLARALRLHRRACPDRHSRTPVRKLTCLWAGTEVGVLRPQRNADF